jgi:hypothetical protein
MPTQRRGEYYEKNFGFAGHCSSLGKCMSKDGATGSTSRQEDGDYEGGFEDRR